jgi:hypothetical protein
MKFFFFPLKIVMLGFRQHLEWRDDHTSQVGILQCRWIWIGGKRSWYLYKGCSARQLKAKGKWF